MTEESPAAGGAGAAATTVKTRASLPQWYGTLAKYEKADLSKAVGQLLNTFIPYAGLWSLSVFLLREGFPYVYLLPLLLLAAGFLVRIFIFFHDCCHDSFFASRQANRVLGYICGVLTFTPYDDWKHPHARHHATAGDLDRRGTGDIWTMTVEEYRAARPRTQLAYRLVRNPFLLLVFGPLALFLIAQRFPHKGAGKRERDSVLLTDLAILVIVALASWAIGLSTYLLIQVPIILLAGSMGLWLFYIQHQFEGVYWVRHAQWDPIRAGLEGSSYYQLPKVLQWFSGNIGLHHIHHLRPHIPNYNLQRCYDEVPEVRNVAPVTLRRSLHSLHLNLWDEKAHKLISFRDLKHA